MSFSDKKIVAIIPARYSSTRLPGKPLAMIGNKAMVHLVYDKALSYRYFSRLIVATDDSRIEQYCAENEIECMLTSADHISGTDRCIEVSSKIDADIYVNIQGDEPFIGAANFEQLLSVFTGNESVEVATLARKISNEEELFDSSKVKVVLSNSQRALYFSRNTIPFVRNVPKDQWVNNAAFYLHIGLYAFTRSALKKIASLNPGILETTEMLEQLRWLENDMKIAVALTDYNGMGIDTPEDLLKANELMKLIKNE